MVSRIIDTEHREVSRAGSGSKQGSGSGATRHGFAYGTLPHHMETGEERFAIVWDRATDHVSFEIVAFSRPRHPLARLGYPYVRHMQGAFARSAHMALAHAMTREYEIRH